MKKIQVHNIDDLREYAVEQLGSDDIVYNCKDLSRRDLIIALIDQAEIIDVLKTTLKMMQDSKNKG